jgi:hypothetical protein
MVPINVQTATAVAEAVPGRNFWMYNVPAKLPPVLGNNAPLVFDDGPNVPVTATGRLPCGATVCALAAFGAIT